MISPLDDPSANIALNIVMNHVANGHVGDLEKKVLSAAPLPNSFIDGFISQSLEVKTMMDHAYNALSLWIEEAKKANYFHKHFTDLSRMINSGVQSMARGLVTLHALGEDLNQSPMSIDDLIDVGSYHFNKSYLGVLQTSAKDPETGFRLLSNQFSWQNTLLRLFRTKEKLEKGAGSLGLGACDRSQVSGDNRCQVSGSRFEKVNGSTASEVKALPDSAKNVEAFEPFGSDEVSAFSGVSGFSAPSAYTQPRAFSALNGISTGSSKSAARSQRAADNRKTTAENSKDSATAETKTNNPKENQTNESPEMKNQNEISEVEKKETNSKPETKNQNEEPINSGKNRKAKETEKEISEELSEENQEDEIPKAELDETKVPEITENEFSEEDPEMNDENSPENSEGEIRNDEEDESQDSDSAKFPEPGAGDGYSGTVPLMEGHSEPGKKAPEMNDENCSEISESGIRNEKKDEGQDSDTAGFSSLRNGSGVTVPLTARFSGQSLRGQIPPTHAAHESTESDPSDSEKTESRRSFPRRFNTFIVGRRPP